MAFAAWCNEHGGIGGRERRDRRPRRPAVRVRPAHRRGLPAGLRPGRRRGGVRRRRQRRPGRVRAAQPARLRGDARRHAPPSSRSSPCPTPSTRSPPAGYRWLLGQHPDAHEARHPWVNLDGPSTVRTRSVEMAEQLGMEVVFDEQYRPIGESSWRRLRPEDARRRRRGLRVGRRAREHGRPPAGHADRGLVSRRSPSCSPTSTTPSSPRRAATASARPPTCARPTRTFDMADDVPGHGRLPRADGALQPRAGRPPCSAPQGLSAFLLFATAATACGAELTRAMRARAGGGPGRVDRRRPALAADPGEPRRHRSAAWRSGVTPEGFDVRRGAHRAERRHLQLRPRQRGRADDDYGVPSPQRDAGRRPWTSSSCDHHRPRHRRHLRHRRPAASSSPTRPRASSTSPTARSACSARSPTGSCGSSWGWPTPLALVVVLGVLAPLLGVVIERVVMRGLDDAPETVALVVVSIGLLAALLGAGAVAVAARRGPAARPASWATRACRCSASTSRWHDVLALALAVVVAVGLRLLLYRTRPGITMRAVGRRPPAGHAQRRPARPLVAAGVGDRLLARPRSPASSWRRPSGPVARHLTLLIVNAYAAAMIGRLRSLPLTFVGAVLARPARRLRAGLPARPTACCCRSSGFAIPVIVLFVVLLVLPQGRLRGHSTRATRESMPAAAVDRLARHRGAVRGRRRRWPPRSPPDPTRWRCRRSWRVGHHRPVAGAARRASPGQLSPVPDELRRHRRHPHGPPRRRAATHGRWSWRRSSTGAVGGLVALPAAAALGHLPGPGDRGVRRDARPVDLRRCRLRLRAPLAISIFGTGLGGRRPARRARGRRHPQDCSSSSASCSRVLYLGVVAVRRSTFGQRLLALKDSPAACATLGINPRSSAWRCSRFSAAIAGFGGALYGGTLGAVSPRTSPSSEPAPAAPRRRGRHRHARRGPWSPA